MVSLTGRDEGMEKTKRLLVFIVAYKAEKTIAWVLGRIPVAQLPVGTEVLVIDDSSPDRTFALARENEAKLAGLKLTVLHNPVNQGYGGNQKLGYQYAMEHGFDVVALVHGDGQYAPEKLPELIQPVMNGEADACFGSRMMERGAALRNGMPLYKYVGNKILTAFQNRVLGLRLSEFHSGYRVYSVAALKEIPFSCNTNDFHFDTEIIIQLALGGYRIREIPIPTYYGDEICYVNGMRYAKDVYRATLASRLHQMGILYQRKYDVERGRRLYDLKIGYPSSHTYAIRAVREGATVLDLASGPGYVAGELKKKGCRVTGVDQVIPNPGIFDRFFPHDLDGGELPEGIGVQDYILMLDCLEHFRAPERLLATLRARLFHEKTRVVVTVPNVAFLPVRLGLMAGQFNYGTQGILDLTHKRLFTRQTIRRLLEQEGYRILQVRGIPAPFVKALGDTFLARMITAIHRVLVMVWPTMFAYQIYLEAEMLPSVSHLLSRTVEYSAELARRSNPPSA